MVPHGGRRAEGETEAGVLEPPADIDVIAGAGVHRIKAADAKEDVTAEGHVDPGDVLGLDVVLEDVGRVPRAEGDELRRQPVGCRRQVWATRPRVASGLHGGDEVAQPVGVGIRVRVNVSHDLPGRGLCPYVSRYRESRVLLRDDGYPIAVLLGDREALVGRAVIHVNDFEVRVAQGLQGRERLIKRARAVIVADDDGNARPANSPLERGLFKAAPRYLVRFLWPPRRVDEPESPVLHSMAADDPIVGPAEDADAAGALFKSERDGPVQHLGLAIFVIVKRVLTYFSKKEWLSLGLDEHPVEVCGERPWLEQVKVEHVKVDEVELEELRGWEIPI